MQDIKFIGTDGDFLLLETADGVRYRLLLDDAVRRASRGENSTQLDAPNLSPREIQEEIRVGRSIQDIVTASGAPEEYIRKFAQPVLDELNHAVLNALMVRLEIAGDRFNEPTAREFGEIIKSRLAASGAGIERWSALKAPDHGFFIYCEFELNGETKKATWSYDPKRLALSPENDVAITLSSQDRLAAQTPKLRPVATTATSVTESLGETVDLVRSIPTHSTPLNTQASEPDQPALSETADLLDALRKKRNERESVEQLEPHPSTEGLRIVELVPEQTSSNEEPDLEVIEPEAAPAPVDTEGSTVPKRGRASIPSWDQIVFGTKTED
jgi:hypothetical protein